MLGIYCIVQGFGLPVGGFLIGLGATAAAVAYPYEKRSVSRRAAEREAAILNAYQRIHCRDLRGFETTDETFTTTCKCATVTRPWSELVSFAESPHYFLLNAKGAIHTIPKRAFPSEGAITEFRASLSAKLERDRLPTSPWVEFRYTPADFRQARWVHLVRGGGWRSLLKNTLTFVAIVYGIAVLYRAVQDRGLALAIVAAGAGVLALNFSRRRKKHYFGPLKISYGEEGFQVQAPASETRNSWGRFLGYLEDRDVFLLYVTPRLYQVMPKRILTGSGRLGSLLKSKLRPFDYRNPMTNRTTALSGVQQS